MSYKWKLQPITPQTQEAAKRLTDEIGVNPILGPILPYFCPCSTVVAQFTFAHYSFLRGFTIPYSIRV